MCFLVFPQLLLRWLKILPLVDIPVPYRLPLPLPMELEDDGVSKPPQLLSSLRGPWNTAFKSAEPKKIILIYIIKIKNIKKKSNIN